MFKLTARKYCHWTKFYAFFLKIEFVRRFDWKYSGWILNSPWMLISLPKYCYLIVCPIRRMFMVKWTAEYRFQRWLVPIYLPFLSSSLFLFERAPIHAHALTHPDTHSLPSLQRMWSYGEMIDFNRSSRGHRSSTIPSRVLSLFLKMIYSLFTTFFLNLLSFRFSLMNIFINSLFMQDEHSIII